MFQVSRSSREESLLLIFFKITFVSSDKDILSKQ
jgi:hypothetical protein